MAYAAVVSLHQILEQQQHIILQSDRFPEPEIEHLRIKVLSLIDSLEKIFPVSNSNKSIVKDLETQIRDAIYAAQDTIESYISGHDSKSIFKQQLHVVIESIDPLTEKAEQIKNELKTSNSLLAGDSVSVSSSKPKFGSKNKIVGLEDDVEELIGKLTGEPSKKLEIVPIVGMAGIGKTTLTTALYNDPRTEKHFDTRAWVTVSQEYRPRDIFSGLLSSMNKLDEKMGQEIDQDHLATKLHQSLMHTRYFIVIDDMWDTKIWDSMRRFFPDNENGSRIVLTTRLLEIALYVNSSKLPHKMQFLNEENSWKLLCQNAFDDARCPPRLEEIGKEISNKCGGLGLALVVVGGLLSKSGYTLDYWKVVAEDINLAITTNDNLCMDILSLSYNHLPSKSKGCFLYLGAFPEDYEIPASKLIKLWIAEGFLKPPEASTTLEEAAETFLVDLVERNLVMVRKWRSIGQIRSCKIHDLVRDLCMKESTKEKFFHVINRNVQNFPEGTDNQRRISVHKNILMCISDMYNLARSIKPARSLLYVGPHHHHPLPSNLTFELLRILDALTVYFIDFPSEIVELIHLRYLSLTYNAKIPASISQLQNLLVLIIRHHPKIIFVGTSVLPVEIWNMPKLRHLQFVESDLPDLPEEESNSVFLENLQYLSNVNAYCCTEEVLRNVPNLKRLGMWIESPGDDALPFHIDQLEHLENLKFFVLNPYPDTKIVFQPELAFPRTLKKLSLSGCGIPWEEITVLGQLEFLEVLKLKELAFQGTEWEPYEDEFLELKYLLLEYMDLVHLRVDDGSSCFPSLESLIIRHCYELEEIPMGVGDLLSLKQIELVDCSPDSSASAKQIQQIQKENGNEELKVRVYSSWE